YTKFQNDPNVAFLLVSIDDDSKRLERYLDQMKFPFTVLRASSAEMQRAMGFNDLPSTFYVDRKGIVRYQILGFEAHGDSDARVRPGTRSSSSPRDAAPAASPSARKSCRNQANVRSAAVRGCTRHRFVSPKERKRRNA